MELENKIHEAKLIKDKTDAEFKILKIDSTNKEEIRNLNQEKATLFEEKRQLLVNKENIDNEIKKIKGLIQQLQKEDIPELNKKIMENHERAKKLRERVKDLSKENKAKAKKIQKAEIDTFKYKNKADEYEKIIKNYNIQLKDLSKTINDKEEEGRNLGKKMKNLNDNLDEKKR